MLAELRTNIVLFLLLVLITGGLYPLLTMGVGQSLFPEQANGSLLLHGKGSPLIGQNFAAEKYFHGRPSAAGNGYDATQSGGSNLAPTNPDLVKQVKERVAAFDSELHVGRVPIDLVTTSASGLDPDISVASAKFQAMRVAKARNLGVDEINHIIEKNTQIPLLGFIGNSRVNVLRLNTALDALSASKATP